MPFITCNPGPPASVAFVPTSVSGCRMWLDGADASTITLSGPNVTNVREKANNVNMANTGTVTQTTIGAQSALSFGGAGYLSGNVSSFLTGTVVIVFKATAANNGYNPFFAWYDSAGTKDPAFGYVPGGNTVAPYTTFIAAGTPTTTVSIGTSYVATYSWTGTTTAVGFNGATPTSGTQGAYSDSQTLLWIGYDNGGYLIATIGEILLYNSVLGQTDRQNVEGYLAQKWGLTASLPGGHPGLTTNFLGSVPSVFRIGPLSGTHAPVYVTENTPVNPLVFNFTSFSSGNLTLAGNASLNGSLVQLTPNTSSQAGAAYYPTKLTINSFTSYFVMQFLTANADGAAFVIQNSSATAVGTSGGGLGYSGILTSVAFRLDTYNGTPGNFSTDILTNGSVTVDQGASGVLNTTLGLTAGGTWNLGVAVTYDGTTLSYKITNLDSPSKTYTYSGAVNIPSTVGANKAWVGFTAGTGGSTETCSITQWTFSN